MLQTRCSVSISLVSPSQGFGRRLPDMPSTTEMDMGNEVCWGIGDVNLMKSLVKLYLQVD